MPKTKEELLKISKATQFGAGIDPVKAGRNGARAREKKKAEMRILREEILKRVSANDWDEIVEGAIERAKGNPKDFEIFRDTIGQKPVDKIQAVEPPKFVLDEPEDN